MPNPKRDRKDPSKCPYCSKEYPYRICMLRHCRIKHKDKDVPYSDLEIQRRETNKTLREMTKEKLEELTRRFSCDREIAAHVGCSKHTIYQKRKKLDVAPASNQGKMYDLYVMEIKGLSKHSHVKVMKPGITEIDRGISVRRTYIINAFKNRDKEIITIDPDTMITLIGLDYKAALWFEEQFRILCPIKTHITCYNAVKKELFVYDPAIIKSIIAEGKKKGYLVEVNWDDIYQEQFDRQEKKMGVTSYETLAGIEPKGINTRTHLIRSWT